MVKRNEEAATGGCMVILTDPGVLCGGGYPEVLHRK